MKKVLLQLALVSMLALTGCNLIKPYHMDIEQGTYLPQEKLDKIHTGMTEKSVYKLIGKPQLTNAFPKKNRLDYIYSTQKDGGTIYKTRLTLILSKGKVVKIVKENFPEAKAK
jgi:outer membrane protein assembly factor BamE (lipoprotein component of BamABCDE complex)